MTHRWFSEPLRALVIVATSSPSASCHPKSKTPSDTLHIIEGVCVFPPGPRQSVLLLL